MSEHVLKIICLAVVLLPLCAASITGLFNQTLGHRVAHRLTTTAVGLAFVLSCLVFITVGWGKTSSFDFSLYTWGVSGGMTFKLGFLIDRLSALMMVVVSFVSWMVHIYTIGYMQEDPGYRRFFSYISLFTFGMLMLVMSNNFLQLFFGWEMVGLVSYLLIGFWYQRDTANVASLKAFLVNRVGDFGFLIGIAAILYFFNSLEYKTVFANIDNLAHSNHRVFFIPLFHAGVEVSAITLICLCLFVGAMGKSAQVPLHVWLPDSMEGPTPISALIHAATMVTAGVFMVARMSPLFEYSEAALDIVLMIGALTCVLTGLLGVVQDDIKRVIAYSTLSQLGIMMTAMGASAYALGMFHLMTHAFFKALLFLGAGSVIIALHHEQNIWKMGNLRRYLPITYWTMLLGSLALIGFPFFSGFYSKDLIIEAIKASELKSSTFAYYSVLGSVFITSLYTFRLFFVVFHGYDRVDPKLKEHLHEARWVVWLPLVLLAIPSVIAGIGFVKPILTGFLAGSIVVHPGHTSMAVVHSEFKNAFLMGLHGFTSLPFLLGILGIFVAWVCYLLYPNLPATIRRFAQPIYFVLKRKYGFDEFYRWVIAGGVRLLGGVLFRLGDQWIIDGVGVNGTARNIGRLSKVMRRLQTGYLYHYAFTMITGFFLLFVWLMLS